MPEQTDELRRLAVQLALQLPVSVHDARRVLALTEECLDGFLIEQGEPSSAAERARRIWTRRPITVNSAPLAAPASSSIMVFVCSLAVLGISTVAGAIAMRLTAGYGAIGCQLIAVMVIALLFGRGPALVSAALALALVNLAIVPPTWDLAWPTDYEWTGAVMYLLAAILAPWIQGNRDQLRNASLRAVERPLRVLMRRAA